MFGVGIFEILVILVVAIIALGPNKLPQAIVDIVKFFRAVKKTMSEAKESFDKEIQLSEIKQETLKYKDTLQNELNKITQDIKLDELREMRTESLSDSLVKPIKEEIDSLQGTLNTLNNDLSYNTINENAPLSSLRSTESIDSHPLSSPIDPANPATPKPKQDIPHNV